MKDGLGDLHPSRAVARRMLELENELQRARAFQRRHSKSPETTGRWGLEQPAQPQQEEGWFITYLDMMTLLLVVMIVMLAFSGSLRESAGGNEPGAQTLAHTAEAGPPPPPVTADTPPPAVVGDPGPLPAGSGLLNAHNTPISPAAAPTYPADIGPLPRDTRIPSISGSVASGRELYPGWSAADLAASFIGPPRPAPVTPSTEPAPSAAGTANNSLSEGEALAAGLALSRLGNDVEVLVNERSVSFRVNSEILFDTSQADLSLSGLSVLRRIVAVLADTRHEITVEGHTDSVPVRRNVRYPSNWELSSARAGSVVRYLQANGIARSRLKAVGYADTRPIADNHTPDGRASNRRVELLVEKRD